MTASLPSPSTGAILESTAVIAPAAVRAEILRALDAGCTEAIDAETLELLSQAAGRQDPSIVILAADKPGRALAATLAELRERWPRARVVLVCRSIGGSMLRCALAAGASGMVLGEELPTALGACLSAVRAGQVCVPQRSARVLERPALSSREKQILALVVMGCMNSQIAERLFLAESTVKSHLSSAFGKLDVRSRNEAVEAILDPERGLSIGILALGAEPLENAPVVSR
jgi:DNA-binding NarL/FixJ family response regulator